MKLNCSKVVFKPWTGKMNFMKFIIYEISIHENNFGENFFLHIFLPLRYFNLILEKGRWEIYTLHIAMFNEELLNFTPISMSNVNNSVLSLFACSIMRESFFPVLFFQIQIHVLIQVHPKFNPFSVWKLINLFYTAWNAASFYIGKPNFGMMFGHFHVKKG